MTSRTERGAAIAVLLAAGTVACDSKSTAAAPSASATAHALPGPSHSAPSAPPRVPTTKREDGCRVVKVEGAARVEGSSSPLTANTSLAGDRFLELEPGARVVLRHTVSTREVELLGPAFARPCVDGEEMFILSRGKLRSVPGPGARPGVQVWIGHPWGTASYGNALLEVDVQAKRASVMASNGEAWLTRADKATLRGPNHLTKKTERAIYGGAAVAKDQLVSCERAAEEAEAKATAVLKPSGEDAGPLGDRAAAHLNARRAARATCLSAAASAALAADPAQRGQLARALEAANSRWKRVPRVSR